MQTISPACITVETIKLLIGKTWFDVQDEHDSISIDTRSGGDVAEGTAGDRDIDEGRRLLKLIRETYPTFTYESAFEVVDEWVTLSIKKAPYDADEVRLRAEAQGKKELSLALNKLVGTANVNATAPELRKTTRDTFQMHIDAITPDVVLTLDVVYGQRLQHREYSRFALLTLEDAIAAGEALIQTLDMIEVKSHGHTPRGPWTHTTGNYPPPNNILEITGKIEFQIVGKLKF